MSSLRQTRFAYPSVQDSDRNHRLFRRGQVPGHGLFEDAGYFCVDNLPPEMIGQLAELFEREGSKVERAAVVSDVRAGTSSTAW